ncbi:unnamed protein product, partial [Discosporangium mesarthrocarpum]
VRAGAGAGARGSVKSPAGWRQAKNRGTGEASTAQEGSEATDGASPGDSVALTKGTGPGTSIAVNAVSPTPSTHAPPAPVSMASASTAATPPSAVSPPPVSMASGSAPAGTAPGAGVALSPLAGKMLGAAYENVPMPLPSALSSMGMGMGMGMGDEADLLDFDHDDESDIIGSPTATSPSPRHAPSTGGAHPGAGAGVRAG